MTVGSSPHPLYRQELRGLLCKNSTPRPVPHARVSGLGNGITDKDDVQRILYVGMQADYGDVASRFRSRAEPPQAVALSDSEAMAWA